jgi:L-alanine-DL-glutamate epimerase-like enolase superfamily enzyme
MNIQSIRTYRQDLALTRPYTIARTTTTSVENVFLEIKLTNGMVGIGAANPDIDVVGESPADTLQNLQSDFVGQLVGKDIRLFRQWIAEAKQHFAHAPGTLAAIDVALHDAFCQYLGISIGQFYGQKIQTLPTSVTIGIKNVADTLTEAQEYYERGFKVLKVKTGTSVEVDIERILKLREKYGTHFTIRVDANQGYQVADLQQFITQTQKAGVELIEQPLKVGREDELKTLPAEIRRVLTADESLKNARAALQLALEPRPYGIFNIKFMKCGGILGALDIAGIAQPADIDLFWGCNDESIVSITAALHTAFACANTRYIDLDGSLDLAEDVVKGGFILENGMMRLPESAGLGVEILGR